MIWYGVEPLVPADRARAVAWAARCQIPIVRRFVARRTVAADPAAGLAAVVSLLKTADDPACVDLLIGTHDALRGRKHVARPDGWPAAFARLVARPDLMWSSKPCCWRSTSRTQGRRGAATDIVSNREHAA